MTLNEYKEYVFQSYGHMSRIYEDLVWAFETLDVQRKSQGLSETYVRFSIDGIMREYASAIEFQRQDEELVSEARSRLANTICAFISRVLNPSYLEEIDLPGEIRDRIEHILSKEAIYPLATGLGYVPLDEKQISPELMKSLKESEMIDSRMGNGVLWESDAKSFELFNLGLMDQVEDYHQKALYYTSKAPMPSNDEEPNQE